MLVRASELKRGSVGGYGGRSMWKEVYGPIAKEQADGATPVIEEFLTL